MKYLIVGVVTLLCMQTINGIWSNDKSSDCPKELADLRANAAKLFNDLKPRHNESNGLVNNIQALYGMESEALKGYSAKDYGEKLTADQLQTDIKTFVDGSFLIENEVWSLIHRIEQKNFESSEVINCFKNNNNLKCQRRVSGACETDLNQLRCDLGEFLQRAQRDLDKASRDLHGITSACTAITRTSRNFYINNNLACGLSCSSSDKEMLRNIKNFFFQYNPEHNRANSKISDVATDSNTIVNDINTWQARLS